MVKTTSIYINRNSLNADSPYFVDRSVSFVVGKNVIFLFFVKIRITLSTEKKQNFIM